MKRRQITQGFTMVELLITMAILGVLFVVVIQIFNSSLDTSMRSTSQAELDTETQKVQQLLISRVKEATRFLSLSDVNFSDNRWSGGGSPYLPSSTLATDQIMIIETNIKDNPNSCHLYAFYFVPAPNLENASLAEERRVYQATSDAFSLIQGRTSTSYTCGGTPSTINDLRLMHPSVAENSGFVASTYYDAVRLKVTGVDLTLQGYKKASTKVIKTGIYQFRVIARNIKDLI